MKCLDCKRILNVSYYDENFIYVKDAVEHHDQNMKHIGFRCDSCEKTARCNCGNFEPKSLKINKLTDGIECKHCGGFVYREEWIYYNF